MLVIRGIDQLHVYADLVGGSLHCSLEDRGNAQLLRDGLQIVRLALVFRSRSPRNDLEIADCRQLRQNFILNAFSKVGVGLVVAQVLER